MQHNNLFWSYLSESRLINSVTLYIGVQETHCEYSCNYLMDCFAEDSFYKNLKTFCWTKLVFFIKIINDFVLQFYEY